MAKSEKPGGPKCAAYGVGYGKPPKHSQFKKGVSGNAAGRPRERTIRSALIIEATRNQVTATIDGTPIRISRAQAIALKLAAKAIAGDPEALADFLRWVDAIEGRRPH